MKKTFIIIINAILLNSCHFFSPVDSSIQTKNVDFNEVDIIGKWKLDKFSYEYLCMKENVDSIYIIFKADSTFILNNSKDLFKWKYWTSDSSNAKENGAIDNLNTSGTWKISDYKSANLKLLEITYTDKTTQTGINVYKKGVNYQIWYFFGDPDTGERLRFLKE
ncbi:hypothetical protein [Flavobacterium sp. SM2513]|uniref:hypothetical protein n=1 Tax=Flavobacterium sp. SM2513 TaxID=3424766 RepID=UPI003D7FAF6B